MKFKQLREKITPEQIRQLKKFYEPLRKVDMSKHKGQIDKTTAQLRRLNPMSLLQLSKQDIPIVSDVAKSILGKMNPKMSTEETVEEMNFNRMLGIKGASKRSREKSKDVKQTKIRVSAKQKKSNDMAKRIRDRLNKEKEVEESLIVGLNKSSAEYKAGKEAAKKGEKYDANPHAPGVKRLNWSTGHNDFRADALRKAGKPNYGARGQFEEVQLDEWDVTYVNKICNKMASRNLSSYTTAKMFATQLKMQGATQIEIHEADLSKAQIKKVHDKADELPKHDFIKRYGKDGDAVRFATATKQVKKELGIDEGTWHIAKDITKLKNTMKQPMPIGDMNWDFVAKYIGDDELWDDFQALKTGQDMRPAIKKAMKRLGIKEEVELTEAISDAQVAQIARMTDRNDHFGVRIEIARLMKDKQLMSFYDSLEKMHMTSQIQNAIGNDAVSLRGKLEKVLKVRMKQRFGDKDSKRIMDAL